MKKAFIILTLLIAFNFSAPNNQALSQKLRHIIEYTNEDKTHYLTNGEILRNKVLYYMRIQILFHRVACINANIGFNSS